jgi:hypothetical protein
MKIESRMGARAACVADVSSVSASTHKRANRKMPPKKANAN